MAARRQRRRDATSFSFLSIPPHFSPSALRAGLPQKGSPTNNKSSRLFFGRPRRSVRGPVAMTCLIFSSDSFDFFYVFAGCNMKCSSTSSGFHASSSRSSVACSSPLICDVMLRQPMGGKRQRSSLLTTGTGTDHATMRLCCSSERPRHWTGSCRPSPRAPRCVSVAVHLVVVGVPHGMRACSPFAHSGIQQEHMLAEAPRRR